MMNLLSLLTVLLCAGGVRADSDAELHCTNCEYSIGGIGYLPVEGNCVEFLQCIRLPNGGIEKALLCCRNDTRWNQDIKNCDHGPCDGSRDRCPTYVGFEGPCPLWADPDDQNKFFHNPSKYGTKCPAGTVFRQENCTCVHGDSPTKCYDDPLLHFPFAYDFNDIQCQKAAGTSFGGAFINEDGGYMQLDGDGDYMTFAFLNNWFARKQPDHFMVSFWFKQTEDGFNNTIEGLFSNGNCDEAQTIWLYLQNTTVNGGMGDSAGPTFKPDQINADRRVYGLPNEWVHVAIRFSAPDERVSLLVNGDPVGRRSVSSFDGSMSDSSVGLAYIDCDPNFFTGCIDDVMVFDREVSNREVKLCVFGNGRTEAHSQEMYTCPFNVPTSDTI